MMRWIYIQVVKSRLEFYKKAYVAAWHNSGPDHPDVVHWKRQWYNVATDAIKTLETTFRR